MIASITGVLAHKSPQSLIVDVHGVGYQVHTTLQSFYRLPELKEQVSLHIYTHHSADTFQLYGFLAGAEREAFSLLLSVSGVGPRGALAILSGLSVQDLVTAVQQDDVYRLKSVPGVGAKTAARLALELKDKLVGMADSQASKGPDRPWPQTLDQQVADDALSALANLGYSRQGAKEAIKKTFDEWSQSHQGGDAQLNVEELIRSSLKRLSSV